MERAPRSVIRGLDMANVLIVDDDLDTVELSRMLLEGAGHRIRTGHTGEEGLVSLGEGLLPDCVVLDVDMPVLGGREMAHEMLVHDTGQEDIPIILVSGRPDLSQIAARMGTPYFLSKSSPEYGKALLSTLDRALSEGRAPTSA
jgi:CheY-like chemotaxis protein